MTETTQDDQLKPDETKQGQVTIDDNDEPVPFKLTDEEAKVEVAEALKERGPVPIDGGTVVITRNP